MKNTKLFLALVLGSFLGVVALALSPSSVVAQGVEDTINWNKLIPSAGALSSVVDSSNNVYVAGFKSLISGNNWLIKKFSSNGTEDTVNWNKSISLGTYGAVRGLAIDSKNDIYAAGYGYNLVSGASGTDWVIKKFNSNGVEDTIHWNKIYGGAGTDIPTAIAIDSNNNVYVAGTGENLVSSTSGYDWWIKKFNRNGTEYTSAWNKMYDGAGGLDSIESIAIDSNDNVYVAGYGAKLTSGASGLDIWIKKFNSSGTEDTTNWNKIINFGSWDAGAEIAVDANNNLYLSATAANLVSGTSGYDWWIKKFNSNGAEDTVNWNKMYDAAGFDDTATSITIDSSNNVYVGGEGWHLVSNASGSTVGYDWWIKKFNSNGAEDIVNWNKMYDGANAYDIVQSLSIGDSGSSLYVAGVTTLENGINILIKKFTIDQAPAPAPKRQK